MTRMTKRGMGAAVAASALALTTLAGAPAYASDAFGQHVRNCAQMMGFDGQMNPGMHQGYAGWDPSHTC